MTPGPFDYSSPATVSEAIDLLAQHGYDAKVLAGGQSLIPVMRFRLFEPTYIIDINNLSGLSRIDEQNGYLSIGALAREADIERSQLIRQRYPAILETAEMVADPLVRNRATMGGNLAHGDPANDHPATMLALRAEIVAIGPNGERVIPIDDFFIDSFTTALEPDELITEIRIPHPNDRSGGAYAKLERKVGDYAIAATAACITLDHRGMVTRAGIGLTNASYIPLRAHQAEAVLEGREPHETAINEAAEAAAAEADLSGDLRSSVKYKRAMIRMMTRRALHRAVERAQSMN